MGSTAFFACEPESVLDESGTDRGNHIDLVDLA